MDIKQIEIEVEYIFEYLVNKKSIYSIFPLNSDVEKFMNECKYGLFVDFEDKFKLNSDLNHILSLHYNKTLVKEYGNLMEEIKQYSRKSLTGKLATLLENIVASQSSRGNKESQL